MTTNSWNAIIVPIAITVLAIISIIPIGILWVISGGHISLLPSLAKLWDWSLDIDKKENK